MNHVDCWFLVTQANQAGAVKILASPRNSGLDADILRTTRSNESSTQDVEDVADAPVELDVIDARIDLNVRQWLIDTGRVLRDTDDETKAIALRSMTGTAFPAGSSSNPPRSASGRPRYSPLRTSRS